MKEIPDLSLRKFLAPEIVFGPRSRMLAGRYTSNFGLTKVLVMSDKGVFRNGWTEEVISSLGEEGVSVELFLDISPNPRDTETINAADLYRRTHCEGIVAVGGGSPIDCAKITGILVSNQGNPLDYVGIDRIPEPIPPLVCVPTTSGSSADVSQFAILTDTKRRNKVAFIGKTLVPDISLVDPETTMTMDLPLTSATVLDALTHAFEAYVSTANSPITDIHAVEAVRLIFENFDTVLEDPENLLARSRLTRASMEAGLAFSNASLGVVHALAHSLGGFLDVPHGECNAILLIPVVKYNWPEAGERYASLLEKAGLVIEREDPFSSVIGHLERIESRAIIERSRFPRLDEKEIDALSERAVKDPCLLTNPRKCARKDLRKLYEDTFA